MIENPREPGVIGSLINRVRKLCCPNKPEDDGSWSSITRGKHWEFHTAENAGDFDHIGWGLYEGEEGDPEFSFVPPEPK